MGAEAGRGWDSGLSWRTENPEDNFAVQDGWPSMAQGGGRGAQKREERYAGELPVLRQSARPRYGAQGAVLRTQEVRKAPSPARRVIETSSHPSTKDTNRGASQGCKPAGRLTVPRGLLKICPPP